MPLLLHQNITDHTKIAVWKIEEDESFFLHQVQLLQIIHHPHKRLQHLAGRYLLSLLYHNFPHADMLINEAGKPYLPSHQYFFSVSHCGDYAAVIASTTEQVGIDIELFSSKTEKVKYKYLNEDELGYVDSLRAVYADYFSDYQLYTLCWCAKEAVYKWWGNGKIDFRKNIFIQEIDIQKQSISVLFNKLEVSVSLTLSLVLLQKLSIVWTTISKKN